MKNDMNIEEELTKILSEEFAKSIDTEIIKNIRNMVKSRPSSRKDSIEKIYKKYYNL